MVLRPVYQAQGDEHNMQYPPYPQSGQLEQGTWRTPWGAEGQNQTYNGYNQSQDSHASDMQGPYRSPGPYGAAGESSSYYTGSQPPPADNTTYPARAENDYAQQAYGIPTTQQVSYQAPSGPYGYDHENANPFGGQASHQQPAYQQSPEIKEEERTYSYGQPNSYHNTAGYDLSSVKQEGFPERDPAFQTEQDRGVMGALAGAAAGGYAGHKMHHGVLGFMGGAYAGHKLEDAYKDHQKHNKPPSPVPAPPVFNQPPTQPPMPSRRGNFSASSKDITLDKDFDLIAQCKNIKGQKKLTAISLNDVITNDNGHFRWVQSGGNFGGSARNVKLVDGGRALEAELRCIDGRWNRDTIRLDDRIENSDGDLRLTS